jgi:hypothetical protein
MADLSQVREHMEIVGADGVKVGTVDKVDGDRIKMTKADSGSHSGHHHYISKGLVAAVESNRVRLSANADAAVLLEEEQGGEGIMDSAGGWKKYAIGAVAVGAAAAAGAFVYNRRKGSATDTKSGGDVEVDVIFVPDTATTTGTGTSTAGKTDLRTENVGRI